MKTCDLHLHSTRSDGTFSPSGIVDLAIRKKIKAIALTDHNVVDGLEEFYEYAEGKINYLGGCEFTTEYNGQELHLLGLGLKPKYFPKIREYLARQNKLKEESNRRTIENLARAGYPVDYAEFRGYVGEGFKNRANIASYLEHIGVVKKAQDAFDVLLSPNNIYYAQIKKIDFQECIDFIHSIGGVTIWAHPLFHVDKPTCDKILATVKGIDGVEVYYSTYSLEEQKFMLKMAKKYHLIKSGGSDFHGSNKPDIQIGKGRGNLKIPYSCYKAIVSKLKD